MPSAALELSMASSSRISVTHPFEAQLDRAHRHPEPLDGTSVAATTTSKVGAGLPPGRVGRDDAVHARRAAVGVHGVRQVEDAVAEVYRDPELLDVPRRGEVSEFY